MVIQFTSQDEHRTTAASLNPLKWSFFGTGARNTQTWLRKV